MTDALIVDYGTKRERFPFATAIVHTYRADKLAWCKQTFKDSEWHYWYMEQRIYFKKKKHINWYRLRWSE